MANNSTGRRLWNRGRSGFRGFITVHPWFKLFSFLLAMGMWLWVQREQVIDGLVEVDVQYRWPSHLVLTSDPPETIEAVIRGTRSEVQRARVGALVMYIDMRETNSGVQTLAFVDQDIQGISESVKVVNLRQRDFDVVLEHRRDKRVRVEVDTIGEPMRDTHVAGVVLHPEHIWIEGPSSVVAEVDTVKTVGVPLANQQETFTVDVAVVLPEEHLRRRDDALIKVTVELEESRATTRLNGVTLRPPSGWRAEPGTVDVLLTGPTSVLEAMAASDLLVTGSIPEDMPRVKLKVQSQTFQVVHSGPESIRTEAVFPEEVVFEPVRPGVPENPIEPPAPEPATDAAAPDSP